MLDGLQTFGSQEYPFLDVNPSIVDETLPRRRELDSTVFSRQPDKIIRVEAGEGYILVEVPDAYPEWFQQSLETIVELLNLPENWDSYGAQCVEFESAVSAIHVLAVSASYATQPAIVPTAQGFIQLEWHRNGVDLEVRTRNRASISVSYEREGFEDNFECQVTELARIETLLSTLADLDS